MTQDKINHPSHYIDQSITLEPIFFLSRFSFVEGNALKYCFRAGKKEGNSELDDLKKAMYYINYWMLHHSDYVGLIPDLDLIIDAFSKSNIRIICEAAIFAQNAQFASDDSLLTIFMHELSDRVDERIKKLERESE